MPKRDFHLHDGKTGSALAVRVTPRASHNQIVEVMDDGTVKIHLNVPPVDDETNEKLIEFLSEVLGTPKNRIEIVAGDSGRDKLISVLDMDADAVHKRIIAHVG
jgi:hypothetical protein